MTKIRIICWCAYKTKLIVVSHTCLVYVNTLVPHPSKWGYSHGTLHPRVAGGPNFFLPNLFVYLFFGSFKLLLKQFFCHFQMFILKNLYMAAKKWFSIKSSIFALFSCHINNFSLQIFLRGLFDLLSCSSNRFSSNFKCPYKKTYTWRQKNYF